METKPPSRKAYLTDVSDEEWGFVAPYLTLISQQAPQRHHDLREVFNALRWIVHTGAPWRYLPGDFPPWEAVSQQTRRWLDAGVFAAMVHDLREMLRWAAGRKAQPTAAIFDSATRQSTPESGHRAGYDGYKRRKGSKIHLAVDTLGEVLAVLVTPADAQDREQVAALAAAVQEATGQTVELAFVDPGYTGEEPAADAAQHGIRRPARHTPGSRQAARGQARLRLVAAALGGGALVCLGRPLPPSGQGLRTPAGSGHRLAFPGLCLPHAPSFGYCRCSKSITGSRSGWRATKGRSPEPVKHSPP